MSNPYRQRLFLRVMMAVASLALAGGMLELCLSGAVHQLALAIVMFALVMIMYRRLRRAEHEAGTSFIPPQSESA